MTSERRCRNSIGRPALTIIPSTDAAFREHVSRLVARQVFTTADELASRLQTLFPRVAVRPSEVSGHNERWYVYRDGVWRSSEEAPWWDDPRTPRVTVTLDGWIEAANAPARAILGLSPADQLPRFFADFVAPGTSDDATALFAVLAAGHELSVTVLVRPSSGPSPPSRTERTGRLPPVGRSDSARTRVYTLGDVLGRWRAAERALETVTIDSPDYASIRDEVEDLRAQYQRLFDARQQVS